LVTMPQVTLAGQTFAGVPAVLADSGNDKEATQMANVGIGLLKQFGVDLDLGNNRIFLTPRNDAPPFERDRAGARFDLAGPAQGGVRLARWTGGGGRPEG